MEIPFLIFAIDRRIEKKKHRRDNGIGLRVGFLLIDRNERGWRYYTLSLIFPVGS